MDKTKISEKLKEAFSFKYDNFSAPIQWTDAVGISRVKKYSNGYASLYKLGIIKMNYRRTCQK